MTPEAIETSTLTNEDEVPSAVRQEIIPIFINALLEVTGFAPIPPSPVYHYCDANALKNIIEKQELWATDLSYCNDAQEVLIGRRRLRAVCASMRVSATDSSEQDILDGFIDYLDRRDRFHCYGCCFSLKGDQLGQWRGYADSGKGYSIGFSTSHLIYDLAGSVNNGSLLPVVYKKREQKRLCEAPLGAVLSRLAAHVSSGAISLDGAVAMLDSFSALMTLGIKHKGFREEKEVRYALQWSPSDVRPSQANFRPRGGLLIPYLLLKPRLNHRFKIEEIIFGPGLGKAKAMHSLRTFLDKNDYQGTRVRPSSIPYLP